MKAIEFISRPHNGIITIPKQFTKSIGASVRVIVLIDDVEPKIKHKKQFRALSLKTKKVVFDRQEANER
ncbi:MAG: hypothetical protein WCT20_04170 [Candidatus Babeliales bacterium]|jgi:hypothetical protein